MKIQTLKRQRLERECPSDLKRTSRNLNPDAHPHQRAREYTRAVQAAKLDRMFAQPLIGNLGNGHRDAVTCSSVNRRSLLPLISGCADGTVALWDLTSRTQVAEIPAHSRVVNGVVFSHTGQEFYSCSDDGQMHRWSLYANDQQEGSELQRKHTPLASWKIDGSFKSIDHHWLESKIVTASDSAVQLWTVERNAPLQTYSSPFQSDDTVTTIRFHPVEEHLVACTTADRGIGLFDTRTAVPLSKTILRMRSNDLQWNPQEPVNFVVGNEDYNAYLFDMRKLQEPARVYKGHRGAVMGVSWSPTGREFVTGSYDRTIRIFRTRDGTAREIYHTKRMQRVLTVQYTQDQKFVLSGSDESNIRLWKANASEQLGQLTTREEAAQRYRQALLKRYQHVPEVRRIHKSRKVPKVIRKQTAQAQLQKESADRKLANRIKYDKKDQYKFVGERQNVVVNKVD